MERIRKIIAEIWWWAGTIALVIAAYFEGIQNNMRRTGE